MTWLATDKDPTDYKKKRGKGKVLVYGLSIFMHIQPTISFPGTYRQLTTVDPTFDLLRKVSITTGLALVHSPIWGFWDCWPQQGLWNIITMKSSF